MPADEQHPTSFRFTPDELAALDELAQLLYDVFDGEVAVTRKVAVTIAVRRELARMRGAVIRGERQASRGERSGFRGP